MVQNKKPINKVIFRNNYLNFSGSYIEFLTEKILPLHSKEKTATPKNAGNWTGLNNSEAFSLLLVLIISKSTSITAKYTNKVHKFAHLDHLIK